MSDYKKLVADMIGERNDECITAVAKSIMMSRGDIMIDLGANIGQQIEYLKGSGVEIHAFEPHPALFSFLEHKYSAEKNITLVNGAADIADGTSRLYFKLGFDRINGGASLDSRKNTVSTALNSDVTCVDISRYIFELEKKVKCLKIDVEGTEYKLIENIISSGAIHNVENILLEDHGEDFQHRGWHQHALKTLKDLCATGVNVVNWYGPHPLKDEVYISLYDECDAFLTNKREERC